MRGLWVALLLLGLGAPARPDAALDLLGGDAESHKDQSLSALHREYDKSWRHRVGSAAAEPVAEDDDVAEGDAAGPARPAEQDSAFEDAVPKRRRYSRKRPRPGQEDADGEAGVAPKRRKHPRDEDDATGDDYRRRKPSQRRRRPPRPEADAEDDVGGAEDESAKHTNDEQPAGNAGQDLKALLKQTAGQLSLSELLQNRNLSLSDLLKGNRGALSALTATQTHPNEASSPSVAVASVATSAAPTDLDREPSTERHNSFVPSKPRRLPSVTRPYSTAAPSRTSPAWPRTSEEPEVTTSRPRRLPAVVARVKAEQHQRELQQQQAQSDALDPMNPAMMAMITLEAADSHTSKPRRIPSAAPPVTTPSPSTSSSPSTTTSTSSPSSSTTSSSSSPSHSNPSREPVELDVRTTMPALPVTTLPPRDFYPLNVDSLEITTPRLMGVSKAAQPGRPSWPPADRIIDAQVFSPGTIANKFRPHGFVASTANRAEQSEAATTTTTATPPTPPTPPPPPPPPASPPQAPQGHTTLQNTSDHFRLENETLDLKEGSNALDKRKIGAGPGRPETAAGGNATTTHSGNDLDGQKTEKRKPVTSTATSTSSSTGPRRLPPTLAGTRRLPAPNPALTRPKSTTTEAPERRERPERPRLPFLSTKGSRLKDKERERDALLPPTRFALPLPEVISVEKMIADARNRGALDIVIGGSSTTSERPADTTTTTSTTAATTTTTTTFTSHDEILDLLKSEQSSTRLARILAERNMTLEDLLQHRERGSSQLHFADFFRNASAVSSADKSSPVDDSKPAVDLVPKEITPTERKENVNILRSFHEVPKYPFGYGGAVDSEEAASTLSLVNVKPAGIVLSADPGERYHHRTAAAPAATAPSRAPRVIPPQQSAPPPPPPPPQLYPVPTFRIPESPAHAGNPYLVIKHFPDKQPEPHAVLEHFGEIQQVGVSSSVEEAMVVDSNVRDRDRSDRLDRLSFPNGVKSAIIASTVICGLAIVGFLTIFIVFRWRQKRALIRARGAILCEQLQRGSFRGRSLSPVLVNVSKNSQVQPMQGHAGGPVPYYSKKDLSSRATSNTASNRHYYLWRSLRKTFQEDDME